jgi:hypothetical protein
MRGRAVLVTPVPPSDRGNGLAMRAGVTLDGLRRELPTDVVVAPAARPIEQAFPPDTALVYVLRLYVAPFAISWARGRAPVVVDIDEDDAAVQRQLAAARRRRGDSAGAAVADRAAAEFDALAAEWLPRADLVVDANAVPNPVPPCVPADPVVARADIVFVGNLSYEPNVIAVERLCTRVVPRVRAVLDRPLRVAVIGSRPVDRVRAVTAASGCELVADPPSVSPWYERAGVAIVPLDVGGGTRLKVLEAFAHGVPVVSTPLGVEGLPVVDGDHALLADDDDGLAHACTRLLRDAELARRLVTAAGPIAVAHRWDAVAERVRAVVRPLVGHRATVES